jgi:class 3 adenylate cyclase
VAEQPAQRRLAAIMAADVVGYSRLMHEDEVGTLARLKALRDDVLDPRVAEFHGRVVKTTGDGVLVEFASAVDAVQLAVDVQSTLAERNAGVEGDDIFGDGVNVAARLEAMAEPGRVYVSGTVFDQVKDKVDLAFDDLGLREIKNIPDPVRTYRVVIDGAAVAAASATGPSAAQQDIRFCTAPDGVGIAYATVGSGFPLVKTANWLNHLEYD